MPRMRGSKRAAFGSEHLPYMSAASGRPAKRRSLTRNPTLDADVVCRLARDASKRQVKASWSHDGTLLFHLARSHPEVFANVLPGGNTHKGTSGR